MAQILMLTQVLPYPLDAGPKIRAYHMLRHLAETHQVTLVSFVRPDDRLESIQHLRGICHEVHPVLMRRSSWRNLRAAFRGLATGLPLVIVRDEIGDMRATLRRLAQNITFDVIHADQLSTASYGRHAQGMTRSKKPRMLLDEHNAIYVLTRRMAQTEDNRLRRLIMAREARAFAHFEASMCQAYDEVLTVSEEDRKHLLALLPADKQAELRSRFTVVPICVDAEQVSPVVHQLQDAPTILHLGTMFWPPNVAGVCWFAQEVLPLIHRELPDARLVIVGKNPPPEVQSLAADSRVTVTGYVADPMPYLAAADAFIVPLHAGGGMRVKILDAWLWELPIVSTPIGAEGIEAEDGVNILIAPDGPTFARATLRLLTDDVLNRKLRINGRAWVKTHYAWQVVYQQVDKVYGRLLDGNTGLGKRGDTPSA